MLYILKRKNQLYNKISIISGTLNRREFLPGLINNTIKSHKDLELVLVDGGSTDGTLEYLDSLAHPRLKVIKYGKRSTYPHFMNLGIKNATHEWICQWNDDVLLFNSWDDVFKELNYDYLAYLFSWNNCTLKDAANVSQWHLLNNGDSGGEVVMNYGIYHKFVFDNHGLYNTKYRYYCADGEMALRAYCNGIQFKNCSNIKVCSLPTEKIAQHYPDDATMYYNDVKRYHAGDIDKVKKLYD